MITNSTINMKAILKKSYSQDILSQHSYNLKFFLRNYLILFRTSCYVIATQKQISVFIHIMGYDGSVDLAKSQQSADCF